MADTVKNSGETC